MLLQYGLQGCLIVFLQFFTLVSSLATTSYISLTSKELLNDSVDLLNDANSKEPVVVFQFEQFPLFEKLISLNSNVNCPFFTNFFKSNEMVKFTETQSLDSDNLTDDMNVQVYDVGTLPQSTSELLYDSSLDDKVVFWFNFENLEYNLDDLDSFLESCLIFLEDSLDTSVNVLINIVDEGVSVEDLQIEADSSFNEKRKETKHKSTKDEDEHDDSLSKIWTEGLLMCLLVSLLLRCV